MKKQLLQACIVMLLLAGIQLSSCRKTTNEEESKSVSQNEAALQKVRDHYSSQRIKLFSKRITLTDAMIKSVQGKSTSTGRGPCNFTFTGSYLEYNIATSPCLSNDYVMNFTFYLYVNGPGSISLTNDYLYFNSYLLSNPGEYTYSYGVPPSGGNPSGNGFTFTGTVGFSDASIGCGVSTADLDFIGDCVSLLCNPGDPYNISIPVPLRPSACTGESPILEIYPDVNTYT
jgi:hypothetical protein